MTAKKAVTATKTKVAVNGNSPQGGSFDPVVIDTSNASEIPLRTLFTIDGVDYQVPEKVRPNIAMSYLRDVSEVGEEYALAKAMEALLGSKAMNALAECDAVGEEELGSIMKIVSDMLFSTMSSLAGKSGAGPVK